MRDFARIADDLQRSKSVLDFYINSVGKFQLPDPTQVTYEITDGPNDGGLDGYMVDPHSKVVILYQCKWYRGGGKLSLKDSLDLHRFYKTYLQPGETGGLSSEVKAFIGRFHSHYSDYDLSLVYLTTATLDEVAIKEYNTLGLSFKFVTADGLAEEYTEVLAEQERVSNEAIFSLAGEDYLRYSSKFPPTESTPEVTVDVLQCAVRGIDLKRAYETFEESIFSRNLRLGLGGRINRELGDTAKSDRRSAFYVLHNGISVVCSDFRIIRIGGEPRSDIETASLDRVPEEDRPYLDASSKEGIQAFVYVRDFQIVNGAQTTITLAGLPEQPLKEVILPCKISKTPEIGIASQIAVCNNTQNKITSWDLVANSPELTLLQNYASRLDPPVFVQRRRGESWSQVRFASGPRPQSERSLVASKIYQAFLSFNGHPGPAYSRPGSVVEPNSPAYQQIREMRDIDAVLVAGLLEKYEEAVKPSRGDPDFATFWTQWAIGLVGHYFKYRLKKEDQWALKHKLLSAKGTDAWKKLRKYQIGLLGNFLKCFTDTSEPQKIFKNGEEEWESAKFTEVKPKDIWPYVRNEIRENSFETMRDRQKNFAIDLAYYDVNFAILAVFANHHMDTSPPPKLW